uniref:Beta-defensin n=1 Tax=Cricetulus griseus TaxID=10029 RepID=A0A8C2LQV0_CRIGR
MLPPRPSALSGHIKLCFLTLAVFVVLAHTSPDGWLKTCSYGLGKCRHECKTDEKKKERCGDFKFCCIPISRSKLYTFAPTKHRTNENTQSCPVRWRPC